MLGLLRVLFVVCCFMEYVIVLIRVALCYFYIMFRESLRADTISLNVLIFIFYMYFGNHYFLFCFVVVDCWFFSVGFMCVYVCCSCLLCLCFCFFF